MCLRPTKVRELPHGRRVDLGASVVTHVLNRAEVPHVQVQYKKTGKTEVIPVSELSGDLTPARKRAVRRAFMG